MSLRSSLIFLIATAGLFLACQSEGIQPAWSPPTVKPNFLSFDSDGQPAYLVTHGTEIVFDTSTMGFEFQGQAPLMTGMTIVQTLQREGDETWEMPWGEQRRVRNHYRELEIQLAEATASQRKLTLRMRAYDDGVAFRYEFLPQMA